MGRWARPAGADRIPAGCLIGRRKKTGVVTNGAARPDDRRDCNTTPRPILRSRENPARCFKSKRGLRFRGMGQGGVDALADACVVEGSWGRQPPTSRLSGGQLDTSDLGKRPGLPDKPRDLPTCVLSQIRIRPVQSTPQSTPRNDPDPSRFCALPVRILT